MGLIPEGQLSQKKPRETAQNRPELVKTGQQPRILQLEILQHMVKLVSKVGYHWKEDIKGYTADPHVGLG